MQFELVRTDEGFLWWFTNESFTSSLDLPIDGDTLLSWPGPVKGERVTWEVLERRPDKSVCLNVKDSVRLVQQERGGKALGVRGR